MNGTVPGIVRHHRKTMFYLLFWVVGKYSVTTSSYHTGFLHFLVLIPLQWTESKNYTIPEKNEGKVRNADVSQKN